MITQDAIAAAAKQHIENGSLPNFCPSVQSHSFCAGATWMQEQYQWIPVRLPADKMKYSAIHQKLIIDQSDLKQASYGLLYAMKRARILAGVPLGKRKSEGPLTDLDYLEKGIIEIGKSIGIDLGADWGYEIDLTSTED